MNRKHQLSLVRVAVAALAFGLPLCTLAAVPVLSSPADGATVDIHTPTQRDYLNKTMKERRTIGTNRTEHLKLTVPYDQSRWAGYQNAGTFPHPVTLVWSGTGPFDVEIRRTSDSTVFFSTNGLSAMTVDVFNFEIGCQYTWKVSNGDGASAARTFTTDNVFPRLLWDRAPAGEIYGVRELGGCYVSNGAYRVKQGLVFRSSKLNANVTDDAPTVPGPTFVSDANRPTWLNDFGIKYELDLRAPSESMLSASPLGSAVTYKNISGIDYSIAGSDSNKKAIKSELDYALDPAHYPLLFHCSIGHDRTGTLAILMHGLLGVSEDDMMRNYESSWFWYCKGTEGGVEGHYKGINTLNEHLSTYAGDTLADRIVAYCKDIGIKQSQIDTFRNAMLEPVDAPTPPPTPAVETFDWLETDSLGYIVTDYVPNYKKTKIEIKARFLEAGKHQGLFMANAAVDGKEGGLIEYAALVWHSDSSGDRFRYFNQGESHVDGPTGFPDTTYAHVMTSQGATASVDGQALTIAGVTPEDKSAAGHLELFAFNYREPGQHDGRAKKRVQYVKIWEISGTSTNLMRHYVAATNATGVATLYDLKNEKFATVSGGGAFVAGNGLASEPDAPAPGPTPTTKKVWSVLGDSYSTWAGLDHVTYPYYPTTAVLDPSMSGAENMSRTWWSQVISHFDGTLGSVVASGGSRIAEDVLSEPPVGSFEHRAEKGELGDPDYILFMGGLNDWWHDVSTARIYEAMDSLCKMLNRKYSKAQKIFLLTKYPGIWGNGIPSEYRCALERAARENGCTVVDLLGAYTENGTGDLIKAHPTARGMTNLANRVIATLEGTYVPPTTYGAADTKAVTYTWKSDVVESPWEFTTSWTGSSGATYGVPNNATHATALFASTTAKNTMVTLTNSVCLKKLVFENKQMMTLALDSGKITEAASTAAGAVDPMHIGNTGPTKIIFRGATPQLKSLSEQARRRMLFGETYETTLSFELPATPWTEATAPILAAGEEENISFFSNTKFAIDASKLPVPAVGESVTYVLAHAETGGLRADAGSTRLPAVITVDPKLLELPDGAAGIVTNVNNKSLCFVLSNASGPAPVDPTVVAKPMLSTTWAKMDGSNHKPTISVEPAGAYTVTYSDGGNWKAAGNYTATCQLADKTRYVWADGTTSDVVLTFAVVDTYDYLTTDGNGYIDAGIRPNVKTTRLQAKLRYRDLSVNGMQIGFADSGSRAWGFAYWTGMSAGSLQYYSASEHGDYGVTLSTDFRDEGTVHEIELCANTASLDGVAKSGNPNPSDYSEVAANLTLFSRYGTFAGLKADVYALKIWNGETLVRDFIPAKDLNGKATLYDACSNVYMTVTSFSGLTAAYSVHNCKKIDEPTVTASLPYDSTTKRPVAASDTYTLGGDAAAIVPGAYTVTVTPNSGYTWQDGSRETKSFSWAIIGQFAKEARTWGWQTTATIGGQECHICAFTNSATWTVPANVSSVDFLVVGGGGAGGASGAIKDYRSGGGGGAGGVVTGRLDVVTGNALMVTVGAGGAAVATAGQAGGNGGESSIRNGADNLVTVSGGGAGGYAASAGTAGSAGGSGGGGSSKNSTTGTTAAGGVTAPTVAGGIVYQSFGHAGGKGYGKQYAGGGGGAGGAGAQNASAPGEGGAGIMLWISGEEAVYAAGGKGGYSQYSEALSEMACTGNGGHGAYRSGSSRYMPTSGGSGIVVIRYVLPSGPAPVDPTQYGAPDTSAVTYVWKAGVTGPWEYTTNWTASATPCYGIPNATHATARFPATLPADTVVTLTNSVKVAKVSVENETAMTLVLDNGKITIAAADVLYAGRLDVGKTGPATVAFRGERPQLKALSEYSFGRMYFGASHSTTLAFVLPSTPWTAATAPILSTGEEGNITFYDHATFEIDASGLTVPEAGQSRTYVLACASGNSSGLRAGDGGVRLPAVLPDSRVTLRNLPAGTSGIVTNVNNTSLCFVLTAAVADPVQQTVDDAKSGESVLPSGVTLADVVLAEDGASFTYGGKKYTKPHYVFKVSGETLIAAIAPEEATITSIEPGASGENFVIGTIANTVIGFTYTIQYADGLGATASWADGDSVAGDGEAHTLSAPKVGDKRFYRIGVTD